MPWSPARKMIVPPPAPYNPMITNAGITVWVFPIQLMGSPGVPASTLKNGPIRRNPPSPSGPYRTALISPRSQSKRRIQISDMATALARDGM